MSMLPASDAHVDALWLGLLLHCNDVDSATRQATALLSRASRGYPRVGASEDERRKWRETAHALAVQGVAARRLAEHISEIVAMLISQGDIADRAAAASITDLPN